MTAPSPTPTEIAKCPNCKERCGLMDGDDGFFVECDGNTSLHEQSNFEPWANGAPCGYRGPLSPDEAEAIRLHNALCRPAPETQAVDRSPVESAPALAPFEKLVEELRDWADKYEDADNTVQTQIADRLSAVVEEVRGK